MKKRRNEKGREGIRDSAESIEGDPLYRTVTVRTRLGFDPPEVDYIHLACTTSPRHGRVGVTRTYHTSQHYEFSSGHDHLLLSVVKITSHSGHWLEPNSLNQPSRMSTCCTNLSKMYQAWRRVLQGLEAPVCPIWATGGPLYIWICPARCTKTHRKF